VFKVFWRLVWVSLKQQTTYQAAMAAGLVTNLFFGLLRLALLQGLYQDQGAVNGLTLRGSITYIAISQASIAFLFIFGSNDLMKSVANGEVATDLLKPLRLFTLWMGKDLGRALVNLVTRGVMFLAIFQFFIPLVWPQSWSQWLLFFISLMLSWLVSYSWRFLVNLAAFWTPDAIGVGRAAFAVSQLFSGFMLPLRLFPPIVQQIFQMTPFPSIVNTPVEIWLGLAKGPDIWLSLGLQIFWLAALYWLCQVMVRAGVRHLVIQGG
jgi:ABC-2 type transport system permease protein